MMGKPKTCLSRIFSRMLPKKAIADFHYLTQATELENAWIDAYILLPYAQAAVDNYETDDVARFMFERLYGIFWGDQQADET